MKTPKSPGFDTPGNHLGVHPHLFLQLAPADLGFPHAGLPVLRIEPRRPSFHQYPASYDDDDSALPDSAADDGVSVAQRVCGGGVCDSSVAGGIRGVGGGTQGCAQRTVLHADHRGICAVCPKTVEGRGSRVEGTSRSGLRPSILDPRLLSGAVVFCAGFDVQADAGNAAFVLLLLDYWPLGRVTRAKFRPSIAGHNEAKRSRSTLNIAAGKAALVRTGRHVGWGHNFCPDECHPVVRTDFPSLARGQHLDLLCGISAPDVLAFWSGGFIPVCSRRHSGFRRGAITGSVDGISTGMFVLRRQRPYFLTGWLWYLTMLAPVIGILRVGAQTRADRYTYLPQIGLYLLLTWAAAELCAGWRRRRVVLGGCATVILAALIFGARAQTFYWRNSESLWTHTLACTSDNAVAHNNLGNALFQKARWTKPSPITKRPCKSIPITRKPTTTSATLCSKRARGRSDRPLPNSAANQSRLRRSPQQPRQRAAPKGQGGRSDHPFPEGPVNQSRPRESPHRPRQCAAPKGQGGRSDRPFPKGAANQSRQRGNPLQPRQRAAPKGHGWTKRSSISKKPCKSIPTTRKPTSISATRCSKRAGG